MTTHFPSGLDDLTAALADFDTPQENPHHRAILDAYRRVQQLDAQLLAVAGGGPTGCLADAHEQLEQLTDVLILRVLAGAELTRLLSTKCCCSHAADEGEADTAEDEAGCRSCPAAEHTIVHACLDAFAADGDPAAMSSADLTDRLRQLPGMAEDRWSYAELSPLRLSRLLAPYGARPRNVRFGTYQLKGYLRSSLMAALPECAC
ncbi:MULTISPECIES: DUF3631 domain-containing protein [unclassified Streptomyces]|uniref:DUF3631 domain-containing protein n=1 Tax=unclassified Streptomyces TaxID=2593676 RepID=UPI000823E33B|nr:MULTISPECIES: DUF3631 domain-containing protein [unclassified Streptomyces]MYT96594.1 DUF3631 domain-containing protein [Streptomyces sp. SID8350]SCK54094.1 Protein of unknown function [Streptomyces sp. AmelKG-D3]